MTWTSEQTCTHQRVVSLYILLSSFLQVCFGSLELLFKGLDTALKVGQVVIFLVVLAF